jgi:ABC-2 type transport system ATP-binding protein
MVGRVKLVLTMARDVPLIILDEPLAGIDPKSRAQILESLISEYNAEKQSIIISTHEVLEAERFFDSVIFLENGKIKLQGNADDLRKEKNKSIQDMTREVFV